MNSIFIYQNEATLKENNKFSIDFIDDEIINFINISIENKYYISSLACNITKANKTKFTFTGTQKLVDDLSKTSEELLDKGSTFKNDISHLTSFLTPNFNLPNIAPQKYALILDSKVIDDNCYTYQLYDTTDKTIKFAKICSPFSHLKNGLVFKGDNDVVKNNKVFIQLVQNYTKIRCIFSQSVSEKWNITANLFRDINAKFVKTALSNGTNKWYATNPNLIWEAQIFTRNRGNFRVSDFMKYMYYTRSYVSEQNGKFKVIGNGIQEKFMVSCNRSFKKQRILKLRKEGGFMFLHLQVGKELILVRQSLINVILAVIIP